MEKTDKGSWRFEVMTRPIKRKQVLSHMPRFEITSDMIPRGDQPDAINRLVAGIEAG